MVLIDMIWCILVTSITFRLAIGKDHMTSSSFFGVASFTIEPTFKTTKQRWLSWNYGNGGRKTT